MNGMSVYDVAVDFMLDGAEKESRDANEKSSALPRIHLEHNSSMQSQARVKHSMQRSRLVTCGRNVRTGPHDKAPSGRL